jgi:formate dehydrogenase subunit gamma
MRSLMLVLAVLFGFGLFASAPAMALEEDKPATVMNPATELWNKVRQREGFTADARTQAQQMNAVEMINPEGEDWRLFRRDELIPTGGWLFVAAAGIVALIWLIRPSVPIPGGESGKVLQRFGAARRATHWVMAISMLVLGITGLVTFAGRYVLLPIMGRESFGALANITRTLHEYSGPLFAISLLVFFVMFVAKNLPAAVDFKWLASLGGLIGDGHPPAGFFNAGEKLLFWLVVCVGGALSASGLMLLFAHLVQDRALLQWLVIVHAVSALVLTATVIGHIYMAVSVKGTMRAMKDGRVEANWARSHHPLWYAEKAQRGEIEEDAASSAAQAASGEARTAEP